MNSSSWEGWKAQVAAAHAEVIEDIKSKFREFREAPPLIDSVRAFCAAIDWTVRCLDGCGDAVADWLFFFVFNSTPTKLLAGTMDHCPAGCSGSALYISSVNKEKEHLPDLRLFLCQSVPIKFTALLPMPIYMKMTSIHLAYHT